MRFLKGVVNLIAAIGAITAARLVYIDQMNHFDRIVIAFVFIMLGLGWLIDSSAHFLGLEKVR